MIGTLNDLKIECADIENAYLTVSCRERAWLRGSIECRELVAKILIVEKASYRFISLSAAFKDFNHP